jgi:hypothetical protein
LRGTLATANLFLSAGRTRQHRLFESIGVLADRFRFTYPEETEIWRSLTWSEIAGQVQFAVVYRAVARLRPDTPIEAAEPAMQVFRDPAEQDSRTSIRIWLEAVHDHVGGSSRGVLLVSALALLVFLMRSPFVSAHSH